MLTRVPKLSYFQIESDIVNIVCHVYECNILFITVELSC